MRKAWEQERVLVDIWVPSLRVLRRTPSKPVYKALPRTAPASLCPRWSPWPPSPIRDAPPATGPSHVDFSHLLSLANPLLFRGRGRISA